MRQFAGLLSLVLLLGSTVVSSAQRPTPIKFRMAGQFLIVVPVMINGAGPFDFQLDTGCTSSIVDKEMVEELHLRPGGKATLATAEKEAVMAVAHTDSIRMGDASVSGLDILVVDRWPDLPIKVRGVLGEDFLRHFDVYIDNRHHLLEMESGPGPLADGLTGEHLALSVSGTGGEKLESNRLVVVGRFDEFRNKEEKLQLDSGAPFLLLCSQVSKPDGWNQPVTFPVSGLLGGSFAASAQVVHLRLGKKFFSDETVIVPMERIPQMNVDGLLPTSAFQSVFISHSEGFVILNPSARNPNLKQKLAESKSPSSGEAEVAGVRAE